MQPVNELADQFVDHYQAATQERRELSIPQLGQDLAVAIDRQRSAEVFMAFIKTIAKDRDLKPEDENTLFKRMMKRGSEFWGTVCNCPDCQAKRG